jgi:TolB-like protein/DNA-binding winged helix-turn-helix (wHTH) protein/Tfp pilus assembly protein PilF
LGAIVGHSSERVSFSGFELNLRTRELLRSGEKSVDLGEQPFLVLKALLQEPGELVSREELIQRLWPADTFVDFQHSLNKAVKRLREALGDSAENPRFIETLPRRGYRFVGTIECADEERDEDVEIEGSNGGQTHHVAAPSVTAPRFLSPPPSMSTVNASKQQRRHRVMAVLVLVAVGAGTIAVIWPQMQRNRLTAKTVSGNYVRSLVVLPFVNLSGDAMQDYFTDGITDALIAELGEMGSLRVISRTSAMQYKGARRSLPDIARELNVDLVVEGTVMRSADRVRITAQLIEAEADRHLWAKSYERSVGDVLSAQSEVAAAIASQIEVKLTPQQQNALNSRHPVVPEAEDAYMKAQYYFAKGTIDDLQKSIPYFQEAIAKGSSAEAYSGLASAYIALGHMIFLPPGQAFPPARDAALKALELDNTLEQAHTALGQIKFLYEWDFPEADKEFQLAVHINPSSVRAQEAYAEFLNAIGRPNEAIERARQAQRVDPLSLAAITDLGWQLYFARRYDEAIAQASKAREMDSNYFPAHVLLGLAYEQNHHFSEATVELHRAAGFCRIRCYGLIGQVAALAGDRAAAYAALQELQKRSYVSPWLVAIIYAELKDRENAFSWLEKAYEGREHDLAFAKIWPMFDTLRDDPRYDQLIRKIGLPR